jgi:GNAT superfamily N-acetyltransferase
MLNKETSLAVDHNYLVSMGALMSNSVSGEFFDSFRMGIYCSGIPDERWNVVLVKRTTQKTQKTVDKWEQFFAPRKFPFRVLFPIDLESAFLPILNERGYKPADPVPVMTLESLPEKTGDHDGLIIRQVTTMEELRDFQQTGEKGFSMPEGSGPFVMTEQILRLPEVEMFIGYAEGRPACTSLLFRTGSVAGIYWVSTLPEFRNRGFGAAITLRAVSAGKDKGCQLASLQASAMGKPVYARIGFDNPYDYLAFHSPVL